tara:strand:- start:814 stop:1884 length:1071 start_codon:yes stop_codon:yes gene_type:complete
MSKKTTSGISADALKALDSLDKMNPLAGFLSENCLSNITEYHDTGCLVLNSIISGSLYKGVPKGRITGFAGPSMAGKTYIINKILANAQKDGLIPVVFDTEAAVDERSARGVGLDPAKVKYVPVQTVEETRNQIVKFLDNVIENNQHGKFIISIDSLGNLASAKEMADIENDKHAVDMGTRAKGLKSMMRTLTFKAAEANVTVLFSNHTYDDPTSMFPTLVKNQSGGKGPVYLASVLVQLAKKDERHDKNNSSDEMLAEAKTYSGSTLRALTVKNRFVPPFLEAEMYLNFKTGLDKYSGLLNLAVNHGAIIQTGSTYQLPDGTKLGYYKQWRDSEDIWEKVLPEIESKLQEAYKYS